MKYFLLIIFLFSPICTYATETVASSESNGVFSMFEKINQEKTLLSEKESHIDYAEKRIEENTKKIEELGKIFQDLSLLSEEVISLQKAFSGEIDETKDTVYTEKKQLFESRYKDMLQFLSGGQDVVKIVEPQIFLEKKNSYQKQVEELILKLKTEIQESQDTLKLSQDEFKIQIENVQKAELALQIQIRELVKKISLFIASLTFLVLVRKFLKNFIKERESFSEEKKEIFLLILRWISNTLIAIIVFGFFFSEFISILPFLAILGTALGFALRDIISSFIAWFIIGLKDGVYKVGDVIDIEADKISGKVIKVSPLVTVVQELGMSGPSGIYLSFPNKRIFETPVKNFSKMNSWIYISMDFFLDGLSPLSEAKNMLFEVMKEVVVKEEFRSPHGHKVFFKKFGHNEKVMEPQVFIDIRQQGIMLRGKVLVFWPERHEIRTQIVEGFVKKAQENGQIKIISVW